MADNNRLVLAYSGGLDTSVAISYLKERTGKDVVAVSLDVGQGGESLKTIKERALACGAIESYVVDARDEFANEYCMKALKANAMYEGVYPLVPTLKAISPIRDLSLTRDVEIAFAKEHKLPITQTEKSPYSIDQNVWGRAIETGFLEDPWNGPTKDCYSYTDDPAFIDKRWGELVYDAQWFSPATQSLNAFIEDTQKYVSGEIRMVLHGGRAVVTGRRSDSSLYDYKLATYDSGDTFDQKSSNGFIDIYGLPSRVAAARDVKFGNGIEVPKNTVE